MFQSFRLDCPQSLHDRMSHKRDIEKTLYILGRCSFRGLSTVQSVTRALSAGVRQQDLASICNVTVLQFASWYNSKLHRSNFDQHVDVEKRLASVLLNFHSVQAVDMASRESSQVSIQFVVLRPRLRVTGSISVDADWKSTYAELMVVGVNAGLLTRDECLEVSSIEARTSRGESITVWPLEVERKLKLV